MGNWSRGTFKVGASVWAVAPAFILGMKEAQKGLPIPTNIIEHLRAKGAERLPHRIPQTVHNAECAYERGRMFFVTTRRKPTWKVRAPQDVIRDLSDQFRAGVII